MSLWLCKRMQKNTHSQVVLAKVCVLMRKEANEVKCKLWLNLDEGCVGGVPYSCNFSEV